MTWVTRLQDSITLRAPDGSIFAADFRASESHVDKKLGVTSAPKSDGSVVQDLGLRGRTTDMTLFFAGVNSDTAAEKFVAAMSQSGAWAINHPVTGWAYNQYPVSFGVTHDPIRSGGVVTVVTSWITGIDQGPDITGVITSTYAVSSAADNARRLTAQDLAAKIETQIQSAKNSIKETVGNLTRRITDAISPVRSVVAGINAIIDESISSISALIDAPSLSVMAIMLQVQRLASTPARIKSAAINRVRVMRAAIDSIKAVPLVGATSGEIKRGALIREGVLSGLAYGMAEGVVQDISSGTIETRAQAVDASTALVDTYADIATTLGGYGDQVTAALSPVSDIRDEHVDQLGTADYYWATLAAALKYLRAAIINLRRERIVYLPRAMSAIIAALHYYHADWTDELIRHNNLSPAEIVSMPAGRRLVIYV